jgi:hypothetical protein
MLRWLAQFFDGIAVKMMLGSLNKEITFEYEQSGHARKEAEEMAWQEMFISMRARNLNVNSYHDVRAWKSSYMADRERILNNRGPKATEPK